MSSKTMVVVQTEAIFSKFFATTKKGKPAVILSDGVKETFFSTDLGESVFAGIESGDKVSIEVVLDPFDKWVNKVQHVEKI